jgi:lysine 2,3-aminomutase
MPDKYTPTPREQAFLDTVEDPKYDRERINGLAPFLNERAPDDMLHFYTKEELAELMQLKGTERDVEARMPVKITRHYYDLAEERRDQADRQGEPRGDRDLEGSEDPGNQMDYAPVEGLLHKYEMGLMYVVSTCSAHCRFCYREELIARKEIERQDGTVAKKGLAKIPDIVGYIKRPQRRGRGQRRPPP